MSIFSSLIAVHRYMKDHGVKETFRFYTKRALAIPDYREEIDTLYYFLNQYADITKVPPAKGKLRAGQQNETVLLQVFDSICRANSLQYIIGFGTLLGYVRHSGFIPWDDDVDVFMPRNDFEKMKEIIIHSKLSGGVKYISTH